MQVSLITEGWMHILGSSISVNRKLSETVFYRMVCYYPELIVSSKDGYIGRYLYLEELEVLFWALLWENT